MRPLFYLACFALLAAFGDTHYFAVKEGNAKYRAKDYPAAAERYAAALRGRDSATARYNLGGALYQQKKYDEAAKLYGAVAESKDPLAAKSTLNFANAQNESGGERLKKEDTGGARQNLEEAIAAYRKSLLGDPSNMAAKHNMEIAQKRLAEVKEREQKKEPNEKDKKDSKDGKEKKDKGDDKKSGGKQSGAKDQKKDGQQQEGNEPPGRPDGMSKEQADRILANLAQREDTAQREKRRFKMQEREVEKDW